jgi:hypothetical protein
MADELSCRRLPTNIVGKVGGIGAATGLLWGTLPSAIQEELVQQAQTIEGMSVPAAVGKRVHDLVGRGDAG